MKRIVTTISAIIIGAFLFGPIAEAQGRGSGRHGSSDRSSGSRTRTESTSRPGNMGRGHGNGSNNSRPGSSSRPGFDNNNRPGKGDGYRPGGNNRPDNKPGNRPGNKPDNKPGYRPDHGGRPDHGYRPDNNHGHKPGPGHKPGHDYKPAPPKKPGYHTPHRPYMPAHRSWRPPVPPPHHRPSHRAPSVTGILGLVFGTAIDITINNLLNSGYSVSGYGADCVYLNNVRMFNYSWPEATLNYVNGGLRGSEFTYSTSYYDTGRYNNLYRSLTNSYGPPVSVNGTTATWWGHNNGYISLSFFDDYAYNGALRYYTTLSIGN